MNRESQPGFSIIRPPHHSTPAGVVVAAAVHLVSDCITFDGLALHSHFLDLSSQIAFLRLSYHALFFVHSTCKRLFL
jgi:hypothetical protein